MKITIQTTNRSSSPSSFLEVNSPLRVNLDSPYKKEVESPLKYEFKSPLDKWSYSSHPKLAKTLSKDGKSRNEARFIAEYLYSTPFYARFASQLAGTDEEGILQLCKRMRYERCFEGDVVFHEGDKSNDKLYVLISGRVGVFVGASKNVFMRNIQLIQDSVEDNPERKPSRANRRQQQNEETSQNTPRTYKKKYGDQINEVKIGESFGDKALQSQDSKRTASIVAFENCEFMIIHREDFLMIKKRFDKVNIARMQFLQSSIPYLNEITNPDILDEYFYNIREMTIDQNKHVTKQGQADEMIYLISKGSAAIEKTVLQPGKGNEEPTSHQVYLCSVGPGSFIGEEILFQHTVKGKYMYNCRVTSETMKVYYIAKSSLAAKFPRETTTLLKQAFEKKRDHRQSLVDDYFRKINEGLIPSHIIHEKSMQSKLLKLEEGSTLRKALVDDSKMSDFRATVSTNLSRIHAGSDRTITIVDKLPTLGTTPSSPTNKKYSVSYLAPIIQNTAPRGKTEERVNSGDGRVRAFSTDKQIQPSSPKNYTYEGHKEHQFRQTAGFGTAISSKTYQRRSIIGMVNNVEVLREKFNLPANNVDIYDISATKVEFHDDKDHDRKQRRMLIALGKIPAPLPKYPKIDVMKKTASELLKRVCSNNELSLDTSTSKIQFNTTAQQNNTSMNFMTQLNQKNKQQAALHKHNHLGQRHMNRSGSKSLMSIPLSGTREDTSSISINSIGIGSNREMNNSSASRLDQVVKGHKKSMFHLSNMTNSGKHLDTVL